MKIVFNTDSLIMGGAEKLAIQYANFLAEEFEVLLLVNEDNGAENNVLLDKISKKIKYQFVTDKKIIEKINLCRELKKKNCLYKLVYNYYLKRRRKSYRQNIGKILKNLEYDILIDFNCKIPAEYADERTISWIHLSLDRIKNKKDMEKKFEKCKKVIVINESMREQFINKFPGRDNVDVLYNPFDIEQIEEMSRNTLGLTKEDMIFLKNNYILACSRLDNRQKDLKTLILAYNEIKKEIDEKLYLIGDGPDRLKLEKLVKKLGLERDIIFLGTKLNPYIWMRNANLFVHSSKKEGFGMVIVEALINDCVIVATDCPVGPAEILGNGEYGIVTSVGNKEKLAESMLEGLKNSQLREKYKKGAKHRSLVFSSKEIYQKLKKILIS